MIDGVSEAQMVVLHPPDTLTDGVRVAIRVADPQSDAVSQLAR